MTGRPPQLHCYTCSKLFPIKNLARIDADENIIKRQIAIARRNEFNYPPLQLMIRLCLNCNRFISDEVAMLEENPSSIKRRFVSNSKCELCYL